MLIKEFKQAIDNAGKTAKEKKLNPIETFCYVIDNLNEEYRQFEIALTGYSYYSYENDDGFTSLPEDVSIYLMEYIDPYVEACYFAIKELALNVLKSESSEELDERYALLKKELNRPQLDQYKGCFQIDTFKEEVNEYLYRSKNKKCI